MKTMKKLVAALLVLTMVLALTGTAMAGCKFKAGTWIKFIKNAYAYDAAKDSKKTSVVVRKGSRALVLEVKGSFAKIQLTPGYEDWYVEELGKLGNTKSPVDVDEDGKVDYYIHAWTYWFKTSTLDTIKEEKNKYWDVTFSNGGNGKSKPRYLDEKGNPFIYMDRDPVDEEDDRSIRISKDCMKHVKVEGKTYLHTTPSLSNSLGKAVHKGDKLSYKRQWAYDTRYVKFLKVMYKGKCRWISEKYVKFVK